MYIHTHMLRDTQRALPRIRHQNVFVLRQLRNCAFILVEINILAICDQRMTPSLGEGGVEICLDLGTGSQF